MTEEETGWKMIHGDVFRNPPLTNLFTAFVGAGASHADDLIDMFIVVIYYH